MWKTEEGSIPCRSSGIVLDADMPGSVAPASSSNPVTVWYRHFQRMRWGRKFGTVAHESQGLGKALHLDPRVREEVLQATVFECGCRTPTRATALGNCKMERSCCWRPSRRPGPLSRKTERAVFVTAKGPSQRGPSRNVFSSSNPTFVGKLTHRLCCS